MSYSLKLLSQIALGFARQFGNDCEVVAVVQLYCLAYLEVCLRFGIDFWDSRSAYADVCRQLVIDKLSDKHLRLLAVGWYEYRHSGECPQHCDVVQRVVCSAESAVCYASADAENGDGIL